MPQTKGDVPCVFGVKRHWETLPYLPARAFRLVRPSLSTSLSPCQVPATSKTPILGRYQTSAQILGHPTQPESAVDALEAHQSPKRPRRPGHRLPRGSDRRAQATRQKSFGIWSTSSPRLVLAALMHHRLIGHEAKVKPCGDGQSGTFAERPPASRAGDDERNFGRRNFRDGILPFGVGTITDGFVRHGPL